MCQVGQRVNYHKRYTVYIWCVDGIFSLASSFVHPGALSAWIAASAVFFLYDWAISFDLEVWGSTTYSGALGTPYKFSMFLRFDISGRRNCLWAGLCILPIGVSHTNTFMAFMKHCLMSTNESFTSVLYFLCVFLIFMYATPRADNIGKEFLLKVSNIPYAILRSPS
jgi:hypothetical protein